MLPTLPEKKMIFKGLTVNKEDMNSLMLTPLIRYPLPGGSALITFEEAKGKCEKSTALARCPRSFWGLPCVQVWCCPSPCLVWGCAPSPTLLLCRALSCKALGMGTHSPVLGGSPCWQWPRGSQR